MTGQEPGILLQQSWVKTKRFQQMSKNLPKWRGQLKNKSRSKRPLRSPSSIRWWISPQDIGRPQLTTPKKASSQMSFLAVRAVSSFLWLAARTLLTGSSRAGRSSSQCTTQTASLLLIVNSRLHTPTWLKSTSLMRLKKSTIREDQRQTKCDLALTSNRTVLQGRHSLLVSRTESTSIRNRLLRSETLWT